ncbi:MAG TPA: aminoacyl-tRNA hydrolase [Tissierellaceae bacterium]|nr:aminoacyl-tRNA hydrolase [Tissierellaceae bacterium]
MYVVVGLGNPGKKYKGTRHNIGFDIVDNLGKRNNIDINKTNFQSVYGEGFIGRHKVILMKPQTYMNNSGVALREIYDFYKLDIKDIIVIVDDIDIGFADIRIRGKGSAGSHNGLKSIIKHLGSQDFPRIKIGVGKKRHPSQDLADFVLSKFDKDEIIDIDNAIELASEATEIIVQDGLNKGMNKFNSKTNRAQE